MKKILLFILILILSATFIISCEGDKKDSSGKVTIKFFHRWPNEPRKSFFDKMIAEFEKENPNVKINVDYVLNDSYKEKIRILVANKDLPDIFTSWSDSFAENIVSSENIMDLSDIYKNDKEWSDNILESQIRAFSFNDKIYGVPLTIDGKAFFYNKEAFRKNGIEVPKTYEELIAALKKLKAAGYKSPIIEGLSAPWTISHYLGTIFQRLLDEKVMKADFKTETAEFTDPAYIRGLKIFKEFSDLMGPTATAIDHEAARNMFISGEVPVMYLQFAEIIYVANPTTSEAIEFGFFDFPPIKGGKGNPKDLTGAPEGFMLSKNAKKEAVDFLKFLTSKEQAYQFTKDCGQLNAVKGGVDEGNSTAQNIEAYKIILEAENTTPWFDNAVNIKIADIFMRGSQSIAIGAETPEQVIQKVQNEVKSLRK